VKILRSAFLILNVLFCASLQASPTSADFEKCTKITTISIQYCLKKQLQNVNKSCDVDSKKAYLRCMERIRKRYDRSYHKAEKEAAIKEQEQY